jgi:hypothetical protein
MAWTAPRTWVAGETVTATMMNAHVRDNLLVLKTSIANDGSLVAAHVELCEVSDKATSGTGETTLHSFNIPANHMAANKAITISAWGTGDGNANAKTFRVYAGALVLAFTATSYGFVDWRLEVTIVATSAAAALIFGSRYMATQAVLNMVQVTGAVDWTNSVLVKVTGQNATSGLFTEKGILAVHQA